MTDGYIKKSSVLAFPFSERNGQYDKKHANKRFIAGIETVMVYVDYLPTEDVAPVVHGRWSPSSKHPGYLVCSVCHNCYVTDEWLNGRKWLFCPDCGAKMDG